MKPGPHSLRRNGTAAIYRAIASGHDTVSKIHKATRYPKGSIWARVSQLLAIGAVRSERVSYRAKDRHWRTKAEKRITAVATSQPQESVNV